MLEALPSNVIAFPLTPEIEGRMALERIGSYLDRSDAHLAEARKSLEELGWLADRQERRLDARRIAASM